ncbi:MAG: DUF1232 domain-containing protein [Gammaproteobacteria bacterium]|nr:DUF1232 domain-containing protein [Gammaproteobacteria bacterium]MBP6053234.1 DUF1232 domain-containing protein [Pseudomonadales bacterium]MBK6582304.1 DUF1232 domain-containing protein [Gammaproteobacteria bacterium]MBK7171411.1 DUF1232 domain-containing protein [Gammaproteobacteria bacterium]MBK7521423.1 DUF1232 domain-containing protein [Gammaproteobacteria bacterium]
MRRAPVLKAARTRRAEFPEERLRDKLVRHALDAGREVVEKVLWLYYAAQRPDVPRWAKLTIYAALAYFVLPTDAVPDLLPAIGYADDLGALSAALLTVAAYVDEDVKQQARLRLQTWFGGLRPEKPARN